MYNFCKITHPATGVELSLYCHFFNHLDKSLVVAGTNIIRVFRLVPELPPRSKKEEKYDISPPNVKLECMAVYTLNDNIAAMEVVSLSSTRDSILMAFKDAKLAIIEYDPHTRGLRTISLHYFEKEDSKGGWTYNPFIPFIRVDPEGRCAAVLIYGKRIVILPFRRDLTKEELEFPSPLSRGPVMQSYIIDPKLIEAPKIDNIIDMQFLHGYYDPTLMLLHEPLKTFPGRVAVRQDTCCLAALSLNLRQKLHPVIWSVANLPHDGFKLMAIPKPIGGVVLFSCNSLTYLTQSVPPYGVSLNSLGDKNTNFPLRKQEGIVISLDRACAEFITDERIVISLKGGELYVLTLVADSMRSVRSFHFEKAASSVLTCTMSVCEGQYLFLGSRLGNSLLLRFTEKEMSDPLRSGGNVSLNQEPPVKRKKLDTFGDWIATDVDAIEDVDILEVYGPEATSYVQVTSFSFEVMDSLLNIGPCGDVSLGEPAFLSEEYENAVDPCIEIVTTSGHGKNGALSVLQRSIKPQVLTAFDLPGITDMWTLVGKIDERKRRDGVLQDHSFLLLSRKDATVVLSTEEEISELEESGFCTSRKTVFAGDIGMNRYIVQVTPWVIMLLEGPVSIQNLVIDSDSPIVAASLADPYLCLLAENGSVMICVFSAAKGTAPSLTLMTYPNIQKKMKTISAYCDMSGLFTTMLPIDGTAKTKTVKTDAEIKKELDDEDDMLYGISTVSVFDPPKTFDPHAEKKVNRWWRKWQREIKPTYWMAASNDTGDLEIYSMPDLDLIYLVKNFWVGHTLLIDSIQVEVATHFNALPESIPVVHEILLVGMGNKNLRPVLFARVGSDMLMYEAFPFYEGLDASQLKLRFCLIKHNLLLRQRKQMAASVEENKPDRCMKLRPFVGVSVYNGDSLRICLLPTILSFDAPWPVRKVPLRCTPHFIVHHLETKTYCVITSLPESTLKIWKFNGDDKEEVIEERDDRFIPVDVNLFSIQLFSPVNWQMIPNTNIDLEKWEHVTCCQNVSLAYEGDRSGLRGYIAVGTNYCYGEDIVCRGRIFLFDVITVVPEPGQPLTKNRLKVVYEGEQKGPVTAITHCQGFLVSAIGQKIYIWQIKDNELVGIAFLDTQIYIHQLYCIKCLILAADFCKSISLIQFQEQDRTLSLVSRDLKPMHVYAVQYMVDSSNLAFLASDAERNLAVFAYCPESRESMGGTRLLRKGDLHLGQHINSFFRVKCRLGDVTGEKKLTGGVEKKQATMFATLDGGLGYVLPISERTYKRFSMIYNLLVQHLPHVAGLNPKSCKAFRFRQKLNVNPSRGILDGELLWSFLHLPIHEQAEIAKKVGAHVSDIIDDIVMIDRITAHF